MTAEQSRPEISAAFDVLAERARNSGYQLIREPHTPAGWALLDAADGEYLHTASSLTEIARYLDE
ncbi:hypothetical protein [Nocardia sp. NPDC051750]|uniref:hypothetical protein n=1 Tax=Nocardia sp. NPDC051750 TaxID=3364325 RepID=UPI00378D8971